VGEEEGGDSQPPLDDLQQAQQQEQHAIGAASVAAVAPARVPGLSALLQDDGYDEDVGAGSEDFEGMRMYTPEPEDIPTASSAYHPLPTAAGMHTSPIKGLAETPAQGTNEYGGAAGPAEHGDGTSSGFGGDGGEGGRSTGALAGGGGGAGAVKPLRLALHNVSGGSAAAASVAGPGSETGGGGSSRRHRQRWDMSPCAPAPTPSPRQLLQEADDGLPSPSSASTPTSIKTAPAATTSAPKASTKLRASTGMDGDNCPAKPRWQRGAEASEMRASADARLGSASMGASAALDGDPTAHTGESAHDAVAESTATASVAAAAGRERVGVSKSIDSGAADSGHAAVGEGNTAGTFGPLPLQKATLGSFVTAAGGDTPASTAQSTAKGPWTPSSGAGLMSPYVLANPTSGWPASGSSSASPNYTASSTHDAGIAGAHNDAGGEGGQLPWREQELGRHSSGAVQGQHSLNSRPEGFSFDV
ncbi:hypothetical protein DUNSADRAFT_3031, partial [Dunaliella salina]